MYRVISATIILGVVVPGPADAQSHGCSHSGLEVVDEGAVDGTTDGPSPVKTQALTSFPMKIRLLPTGSL